MIKGDIIIVGGGASGLMAASIASRSGLKVILLEKNKTCGRKLLITGKGRCNITNMCDWVDFSTHIHTNVNFFKSQFFNFSNVDVVAFFENIGLKTIVERGMRVFPSSQSSKDVLDALIASINKPNVSLITNCEVIKTEVNPDGGFLLEVINHNFNKENGGMMKMDFIVGTSLIIATGGLSYPSTGSTGDGYNFAKALGHTIISTFPSLTALKPIKYDLRLDGITLKNVRLDLYINDKIVQSEQGELTFTSAGIEGALGFRVSRRAVMALNNGQKVDVVIDLKPALKIEQLTARINREVLFVKKIENIINSMLPLSLISPFLDLNKEITLANLPVKLKNWKFSIKGYVGYERAVITSGGVSLNELSRKSMESKIVPGLFFCGEVIDLDGDTGGYNLQIAFSTAHVAATSSVQYSNSVTTSKSNS